MKRPSIQGRWTGRAARRLWRTTGTWTAVACGCWSAVTAEPIHWHSAPPQSFQHLIPFLGLRLADNTAAEAMPDSSSHGWQLLPPGSHEMRSQEQAVRGAVDGGTTGIANTAPESRRYSFDAPLDLPVNTEPEHPAREPSPSATDAPSEELIDEMPAWPDYFGFPEMDSDDRAHKATADAVTEPTEVPAPTRSKTSQPTAASRVTDHASAIEDSTADDGNSIADRTTATDRAESSALANATANAASDRNLVIINPMVKAKRPAAVRVEESNTLPAAPASTQAQTSEAAPPKAASDSESTSTNHDTARLGGDSPPPADDAGDSPGEMAAVADDSLTTLDSKDDWFTEAELAEPSDSQFAHRPFAEAAETTPMVESPSYPVVNRSEPTTDDSILPLQTESDKSVSLPPGPVQQGREYINEGIRQAQRGAIYSSRAQFIKVLRLVSQSLDAQSNSKQHSEALAAGMRALKEAADFRPSGASLEANLDLGRLITSHRSPLLHDQDTSKLSPLAALQAYHAYAEQQLAIAGGHELTAADALYGLAKLQPHLDVAGANQDSYDGPVAMSYYQAALLIYPDHYLAANELGVLFARFGQLKDAREVLRFAASVNPDCAETWLNLARIHEKLGESDLAKLAHEEWRSLSGTAAPPDPAATGRPQVQWVTPDELSRAGGGSDDTWGRDTSVAPGSPQQASRSSGESKAASNSPSDSTPKSLNNAKRRSWPFF